jgi:SAM-dependent MidA family methyltransferase
MSRQTQAVRKLSQNIRTEAASDGVLTFARFMELALYCPVHGYYEKQKDNIGRRGDFYTSVSTGELFGQLLACQFSGWLESLNSTVSQPSTLSLLEAGAHDGKLAKDILTWLKDNRPSLFERISYIMLEPSAHRQAWQQETLKDFSNVRWFTGFEDLKLKTQDAKLSGVIFSNELLDAMPVHRYGWNAREKKWFEWGVAVEGQNFVWAKLESSEFRILNSELESVLPDNYTVEASPAAENWWREAAGILSRGKLLAIDYGYTADELFSPTRTCGTLRAYHQHRVSDDLLANVGEQDLTAHVNFSAIQAAGEAAGLTTESFQTQSQFLTRILGGAVKEKPFASLDARQVRQFQTLSHPEHLGRAFRVLVQSRP